MDRRTLFNRLGLGSLASLFSFSKAKALPKLIHPEMAEPGWQLDPAFSANDYFQMIEFKAGEATDFPLDFCDSSKETNISCAVNHFRNQGSVTYGDWVHIPTFEISAADKSKEVVEKAIQDKVNLDAARVLWYSDRKNKVIINKSRALVDASLQGVLSRRMSEKKHLLNWRLNYKSFTFGPYVVGVNLNRDVFVMPVREQLEMFYDNRQKEWYGWMEFGIACLDNTQVAIGRIE